MVYAPPLAAIPEDKRQTFDAFARLHFMGNHPQRIGLMLVDDEDGIEALIQHARRQRSPIEKALSSLRRQCLVIRGFEDER